MNQPTQSTSTATIPAFTSSGWSSAPPVFTGTGNVEDLLKQAGYMAMATYGDPGISSLAVELYEHTGKDQAGRPEFVAYVGTCFSAQQIVIPDVPALLGFLAMVQPVVESALRLDADQERREAKQRQAREKYRQEQHKIAMRKAGV